MTGIESNASDFARAQPEAQLLLAREKSKSPRSGAEQLVDNSKVRRQAPATKERENQRLPQSEDPPTGVKLSGNLAEKFAREPEEGLSREELGLYEPRSLRGESAAR